MSKWGQGRSPLEQRADETTSAAKAIVDAETTARDAKSAKLKAARLERDAEAAKDTNATLEPRSVKRSKS